MACYHGDGYLWLYCCMDNLYISHKSLYAPTYSFWALSKMLIVRFWVTSWFYSVYNIVAYWVILDKNVTMNKNYRYPTTIWVSILTQIYAFLEIFTIFAFDLETLKKQRKLKKKYILLPEICTFGRKHFPKFKSDNCSSCLCKCFSLKFNLRVTILQTEYNQEVTKNDW